MAPTAAPQLPSPPPITDRIALGALTRTFPPELVDRVIEQTGRAEQRRRLLPARVVVYFVLALALYGQAAYEEVLRCLVEGLGWAVQARRGRRSWPYWHVPGASALAEARTRLGAEPLKVLYEQAVRPLVAPATRGAWYRRWRIMVLDGTCLDVPDTPENAAGFGRPGSGRGEGVGAFPQVRVVGLVEAGTHAIIDAVQGPYWSGEQTLARGLARDRGPLGPGVLVLADRLFTGAELWQQMTLTGAELVWRVRCASPSAPKLEVDQVLADGSWLSCMYARSDRHRRRHPITVRVIEYTLADPGRRTSVDRYRLVTTILDPALAPAGELAGLDTERWEVETALAELKTTQCGPRQVLCSRSPELVAQEVWAHLLVHYALRAVIHTAALAEDLDPDWLSFIRTLRVIRRQVIAQPAFSP
jgi:Insertion element 4 transposase N-terminal/Transposase DDE domain